jgi:hypothetical protein
MKLSIAFANRRRQILAATFSLVACALLVACANQPGSPTAPTASAVAGLAVQDSGLKGVICHATGSATNPFVGVIVGIGPNVDSPIFSNNGHLDANGTALSGHEDDVYIGPSPPNEKSDCNKLPPPSPK